MNQSTRWALLQDNIHYCASFRHPSDFFIFVSALPQDNNLNEIILFDSSKRNVVGATQSWCAPLCFRMDLVIMMPCCRLIIVIWTLPVDPVQVTTWECQLLWWHHLVHKQLVPICCWTICWQKATARYVGLILLADFCTCDWQLWVLVQWPHPVLVRMSDETERRQCSWQFSHVPFALLCERFISVRMSKTTFANVTRDLTQFIEMTWFWPKAQY